MSNQLLMVFYVFICFTPKSIIIIVHCIDSLFTNESINEVKSITYADVIKAALQIADDDIIQKNVFTWKQGIPSTLVNLLCTL